MKELDEFLSLHRDEIHKKIEAGMESLRRGDYVDGEEAMAQLRRELVNKNRMVGASKDEGAASRTKES